MNTDPSGHCASSIIAKIALHQHIEQATSVCRLCAQWIVSGLLRSVWRHHALWIARIRLDSDRGTASVTHGDTYLQIGTWLLHAYWDSRVVKYAMQRGQVTYPHEDADYLAEKYPGESIPSG